MVVGAPRPDLDLSYPHLRRWADPARQPQYADRAGTRL